MQTLNEVFLNIINFYYVINLPNRFSKSKHKIEERNYYDHILIIIYPGGDLKGAPDSKTIRYDHIIININNRITI